jgi:hypothetical protein
VGLAVIDCGEVPLNGALVSEWAEALEVSSADAATGGAEAFGPIQAGDLDIEREQLAGVTETGATVRADDCGQLEAQHDVALVGLEKIAQRVRVADFTAVVQARQRVAREQAVAGAELLEEWMDFAEECYLLRWTHI